MELMSDAAREELERHHEGMRELMQALRELHEDVRAEIEEGAPPREAVERIIEEVEEIAAGVVEERARHLEHMAEIVREEGDATVERWVQGALERAERPVRPERLERVPRLREIGRERRWKIREMEEEPAPWLDEPELFDEPEDTEPEE